MEEIGDRPGAGAGIENAGPAPKNGLAPGRGSVRETETRGEIVGIVVKIILPVVAKTDGNGKFAIHPDGIFDKAGECFFQENQVPVALLNGDSRRGVGLKGHEAGECVSAELIGEIVCAAAADVRNVNTEIEELLAVNPGDDVGAVEMVFGAAGIGLCAATGKSAGNDDLRCFGVAGAGLIVFADQKAELVDPGG